MSSLDGKEYWRSIDRLLDSPAVRDASVRDAAVRGPEFPEGADLPPDEISRRTMLSLMGASFALAGLAGCRRPVEKIVPYVSAPEMVVPGIPRHYATTMPFGTSAYGVVVESHEGRPTKIEGNELHPSSLGAATAWMQAAVLDLYDPDRSRAAGRRAGGETVHRPSSWKFFEAALAEWRTELEANAGEGLAVLSASYASPTIARLRGELEARFPRMRWAVWEPAGDGNVFAGLAAATGTACRPVYHLERAKKIVALDADFLGGESESLRNARGFAAGRRVDSPGDDMSRLYAVESTLTVTGATADHRLAIKSRDVAAFAAALAGELGVEAPAGFAADSLGPGDVERAKSVAADLRRSTGEAVVIAGRRQPPAVHALALRINQALGALGATLTLHPLEDAAAGSPDELRALTDDMRQGAISTLVILGGNPVYDAPADLDFRGALAEVAHSVHLASHRDETSGLVEWHLPASHFLEAWGDARAADGTRSVVQPLIAPLHDSRSTIELLGLLLAGEHRPGHDLVRETWADLLGEDPAEHAWRRVLHDGVLHDDASPAIEVAGLTPVPAADSDGGGLEITFHPSAATFDGRFANLGWLQELPDVITKITWDNAALLAPATAAELGLRSGDQVLLASRGRNLEAPVFVLPGQAEGSVALALGYGRTAAGRVGDGVGVDAYALRHSAAPDFDGGLELEATGGAYPLAQTQEHWSMEGREIVREATLADYRGSEGDLDRVFGGHRKPDPDESHQPFDAYSYEQGRQWGMTVDLNACIGCNACIIACQSENNVPIVGREQVSRGREMQWLRVDRYFSGDLGEPEVVFQPVPCMHCENAPCEQVCPVAATTHSDEGLNSMVYNRCIGTRYCSNNCPYKVRRFNYFNYTKDTPELVKMAMNPDVTVRSRGVMEKCTYCVQRISGAKKTAKMEGREVEDGDIVTACQQTCPTDAIVFGNVRDPQSEVARLKKLDRDYVLLGELNNRPRTSYLAKLRNPNPEWKA